MLAWLSVWSKAQMTCIWSGWCHCHPIISASEKSGIVYPSGTGLPGLSWKKADKRMVLFYTGQPMLASSELVDFLEATFYYMHTLLTATNAFGLWKDDRSSLHCVIYTVSMSYCTYKYCTTKQTSQWFLHLGTMTTKVPSVLWSCCLGGIRPVKDMEWWGAGMVICLVGQ